MQSVAGPHSAGTALPPVSSGNHCNSHSGRFPQRKRAQATSACVCYWLIGGQWESPFPKEQEQQLPYHLLFRLASLHTNLSSSISPPPVCLPFLSHHSSAYPLSTTPIWVQGHGAASVLSGAPWPLVDPAGLLCCLGVSPHPGSVSG